MVGVFIDYNLIASPVPISDDVVIVRGDVPVEIVKPEAFPVAACKHEYVLRSKAAREVPVCPRLRELVMRIAGSTIVSDPPIVPGIDVRNVRMTRPVHGYVVLGRGIGFLTSFGGGSSRRLGHSRRLRRSRRLGSPRRSGTASRNVSTANLGMTAAALRPTTPSVLRKRSDTNQNG
jgi:hypothetical protein